MSTISEIYLNGNSYDEMWLNNELVWQKSGYLPLQYNWGYEYDEDYVNQTNLKGYENNTYVHIVVPSSIGAYKEVLIAPLDNNLKMGNYYLVRGEIYQKSGDDSDLAFHEESMESPSLLGMGEWHTFNACIEITSTHSAVSGGFIAMVLPIYSELPTQPNEYYLRLKTIEETDMTTEYFVYGDEIPEIPSATSTKLIDFTQSSAPTLPSYLTVDNNGTYSFSHGLYTTDVYGLIPSNKGVNNSTAYTRYKFVAPTSGDLTFTYRCYAETNYDYLTVHVTTSTSQPSYSSATNRVFSTKGVSSYQNTDGTASVSVTSGTTYYIHIQYYKDISSSSGYDMGCIRSIEFPIGNTSGGDTSVVYGDIVLSTSNLYVTEGTTSSSLGVKLSQSPTNTQTVIYSYTSDYVTSWSGTLTFDSTNWATYQYVAFTPALDGLYTNRTDTITFTSDGVENVVCSVTVTNSEKETGSYPYSDADTVMTIRNTGSSAVEETFGIINYSSPYSINGTSTTSFSFPASSETQVKLVNLDPEYGATTSLFPTKIEQMVIPSLTNISYLFSYFGYSSSYTYSWQPQYFEFSSGITNMDYMFYNCRYLTDDMMAQFMPYFPNTSNVTSMYRMFYYCQSLTKLDLSHFDTSNVTNMFYMFRNCSALKEIDLSSWDTSKVTSYSYMFGGVSNATIYIGDGWTLGTESTFAGGTNLTFVKGSSGGDSGTTTDSLLVDWTQSTAPTLPSYMTEHYNSSPYGWSHGTFSTGVYGLKSDNFSVDGTTAYICYKYVAPKSGWLNITYRCYAEQDYDWMTVQVNTSSTASGTEIINTLGDTSCQTSDALATTQVTGGTTYYIHIKYRKDSSGMEGADRGCIRKIELVD